MKRISACKLIWLLYASCIVLCPPAQGAEKIIIPYVVQLNNQACYLIEEKSLVRAQQKLMDALAHSPRQPELYLNLGLIFESQKEGESALKSYLAAANLTADDGQKFAALFNAAVVASHSNDIDKALDLYQQALNIDPQSMEIKTNIELLMQSKGKGDSSNTNEQAEDDKGQSKNKEYQPNPTPVPFKSKELTADDVKKIFEELKRQEQEIRSHVYSDNPKEIPRDKDW